MWHDAGMTELPGVVAQAAAAFGLDPARLRSLGGASGSSWGAGPYILRAGPRLVLDRELLAATAAAAVVPVPRIIGRTDFGDRTAVLLERLPGRPAADLARKGPALARAAGRACGSVHALLAGVPAPDGLRAAPGAPEDLRGGRPARLLHLDLHPLNLLVNTEGALTGVLDWANAAAGPPVLDRARTWAILNLDPFARAQHASPLFQALAAGWTEAAGLDTVPAGARAWACRFMLIDLSRRHSPADLTHIRQALAESEAEAEAGHGDPAGELP